MNRAAGVQVAFDKSKDGPPKKHDTNDNGSLEKSEVAAIHVGSRGRT